jgi:anti-sigma B factor antagonist
MMDVHVSKEGAVTVIKPLGPIIAGELNELENMLRQMDKNWNQRIVMDLTDVLLIDSAGLELLMRHHRLMAERSLKFKLCGLNEITQKIFDLTQLSRYFEIYPDTLPAIRSFL